MLEAGFKFSLTFCKSTYTSLNQYTENHLKLILKYGFFVTVTTILYYVGLFNFIKKMFKWLVIHRIKGRLYKIKVSYLNNPVQIIKFNLFQNSSMLQDNIWYIFHKICLESFSKEGNLKFSICFFLWRITYRVTLFVYSSNNAFSWNWNSMINLKIESSNFNNIMNNYL